MILLPIETFKVVEIELVSFVYEKDINFEGPGQNVMESSPKFIC